MSFYFKSLVYNIDGSSGYADGGSRKTSTPSPSGAATSESTTVSPSSLASEDSDSGKPPTKEECVCEDTAATPEIDLTRNCPGNNAGSSHSPPALNDGSNLVMAYIEPDFHLAPPRNPDFILTCERDKEIDSIAQAAATPAPQTNLCYKVELSINGGEDLGLHQLSLGGNSQPRLLHALSPAKDIVGKKYPPPVSSSITPSVSTQFMRSRQKGGGTPSSSFGRNNIHFKSQFYSEKPKNYYHRGSPHAHDELPTSYSPSAGTNGFRYANTPSARNTSVRYLGSSTSSPENLPQYVSNNPLRGSPHGPSTRLPHPSIHSDPNKSRNSHEHAPRFSAPYYRKFGQETYYNACQRESTPCNARHRNSNRSGGEIFQRSHAASDTFIEPTRTSTISHSCSPNLLDRSINNHFHEMSNNSRGQRYSTGEISQFFSVTDHVSGSSESDCSYCEYDSNKSDSDDDGDSLTKKTMFNNTSVLPLESNDHSNHQKNGIVRKYATKGGSSSILGNLNPGTANRYSDHAVLAQDQDQLDYPEIGYFFNEDSDSDLYPDDDDDNGEENLQLGFDQHSDQAPQTTAGYFLETRANSAFRRESELTEKYLCCSTNEKVSYAKEVEEVNNNKDLRHTRLISVKNINFRYPVDQKRDELFLCNTIKLNPKSPNPVGDGRYTRPKKKSNSRCKHPFDLSHFPTLAYQKYLLTHKFDRLALPSLIKVENSNLIQYQISRTWKSTPGYLRVVCISDTHNKLHGVKVPPGDILIHAGDYSMIGTEDETYKFIRDMEKLDFKYKILVAGNHDLPLDIENYPKLARRFHSQIGFQMPILDLIKANMIILQDEAVEIEGLKIYGSPWQPKFKSWAFNKSRGDPMRKVWRKMPEGIDILITHTPPLGHGDGLENGDRVGCVDLLDMVEIKKPRYHVFGHIHEGYGASKNDSTKFINASMCDTHYGCKREPIIFDIKIRK